ncbi:hypothetical protein [Eoetvoesiella caeni]
MATRKPTQLCHVTVGYQNLLLPADKGMRLLELLQHSVECTIDFEGRGMTYCAGKQPRVEFSLIQPDQVRAPADGWEQPANRPRLIKGSS